MVDPVVDNESRSGAIDRSQLIKCTTCDLLYSVRGEPGRLTTNAITYPRTDLCHCPWTVYDMSVYGLAAWTANECERAFAGRVSSDQDSPYPSSIKGDMS